MIGAKFNIPFVRLVRNVTVAFLCAGVVLVMRSENTVIGLCKFFSSRINEDQQFHARFCMVGAAEDVHVLANYPYKNDGLPGKSLKHLVLGNVKPLSLGASVLHNGMPVLVGISRYGKHLILCGFGGNNIVMEKNNAIQSRRSPDVLDIGPYSARINRSIGPEISGNGKFRYSDEGPLSRFQSFLSDGGTLIGRFRSLFRYSTGGFCLFPQTLGGNGEPNSKPGYNSSGNRVKYPQDYVYRLLTRRAVIVVMGILIGCGVSVFGWRSWDDGGRLRGVGILAGAFTIMLSGYALLFSTIWRWSWGWLL